MTRGSLYRSTDRPRSRRLDLQLNRCMSFSLDRDAVIPLYGSLDRVPYISSTLLVYRYNDLRASVCISTKRDREKSPGGSGSPLRHMGGFVDLTVSLRRLTCTYAPVMFVNLRPSRSRLKRLRPRNHWVTRRPAGLPRARATGSTYCYVDITTYRRNYVAVWRFVVIPTSRQRRIALRPRRTSAGGCAQAATPPVGWGQSAFSPAVEPGGPPRPAVGARCGCAPHGG